MTDTLHTVNNTKRQALLNSDALAGKKSVSSGPDRVTETLRSLIEGKMPLQAGRIMGMLQGLDNDDLQHLIDCEQALNERIDQCMHMMAVSEAEGAEQEACTMLET